MDFINFTLYCPLNLRGLAWLGEMGTSLFMPLHLGASPFAGWLPWPRAVSPQLLPPTVLGAGDSRPISQVGAATNKVAGTEEGENRSDQDCQSHLGLIPQSLTLGPQSRPSSAFPASIKYEDLQHCSPSLQMRQFYRL